MFPPRRNLGTQVENWLNEFSRTAGILSQKEFPLEQTIKQLENLLQRRMASGRLFIAQELPYAQDWIDRVTSGKKLPTGASPDAKAALMAKLLDYVLATDVVVSLKSNTGREYQISIDVTCDPTKETEKLNRIQGKREDGDTTAFNRNANLPAVRRSLGIDKHLVLVVDYDNLPDSETLLTKLYEFVNSPARTKSINLIEWQVEQQPDQPPAIPSTPSAPGPFVDLSELVRSIDKLLQLLPLKEVELMETQTFAAVSSSHCLLSCFRLRKSN